MPRPAFTVFFFAVMALIAFSLSGCNGRKPMMAPVPLPVSGPVVAGQKAKDEVVLKEADKIDAVAPLAKPHTDAQRAAIAANPAVDVEKIVAEYEVALKSRDGVIAGLKQENASLAKQLKDALEKTDRYLRLGGYGLSALLVAAGVASFFLAAQVPFLGPRIGFALIAAGGSVFAMMQAYDFTKQHPWVVGVALLFIVVAGVYAHSNYIRDVKKAL
jgi:hypothetical protein